MELEYKVNQPISVEQFISVLNQSGLAERRPVADQACMKGMLENSNLMVSAWYGNTLVGIARSVTDFHYACYLSDLAVIQDYQSKGIGRQLQRITTEALGPKCKLILIAAPAANKYYQALGFTHNPRCWVLSPDSTL